MAVSWKAHGNNLGQPAICLHKSRVDELPYRPCRRNMPSGPKPGAINELEQMHSDQMVTPNYGMENMTDTVASEVETVVLNDFAKQPTPSQQAVTEISTPGSRLQYPKPPRYKPGQVLFTCPCCCVPLPLIFAESRRWRYTYRLATYS